MQPRMLKNDNKMSENYWSRFGDSYDKRQEYVVDKLLLKKIIEKLDQLLELGEVVEFGCGTGYFTKIISQKSQSVVATDISDRLLEVARKRLCGNAKVKVQKEDCMKTSFATEAFDSVFMANLIHVVESPIAALQECHRILRKDGVLIIVTFTSYGMKLWEKIKMGLRFVKSWGKPPAHVHSFSLEDLTTIMEDAGFIIKVSKVIGDNTKALYVIGRKNTTA
ncbi:MAG: methyltransferase domain-containing protein [Spirochaetales bacterium]|nr:methyltransferase domain-containing protein [Spirochaetales bacterium]